MNRRNAGALVLSVAALAACAPGANPEDIYVEPDADAVAAQVVHTELGSGGLSADDVAAIEDRYATFVDLERRVRRGDEAARDELQRVASEAVASRAIASALPATRDETVTIDAAIDRLTVTSVGVTVFDCLEERIVDVDSGVVRSNFVEQLVEMRPVDDQWIVTDVGVRHDGSVAAGSIGCIPNGHARAAEEVVIRFLTELDVVFATPGAPLDAVTAAVDDTVRAEIASLYVEWAAAGHVVDDPVQHRATAVGSDSDASRTFIVSVCSDLPDGWTVRNSDGNDVVEVVHDPGTALEREFVVRAAEASNGLRYSITALGPAGPAAACAGAATEEES